MNVQFLSAPVGWLQLVSDGRALTAVRLTDSTGASNPDDVTRTAAEELAEYFAGKRRSFDLPLAPQGTTFQQAVWHGLAEIPYGHTLSYGQLAAALGAPGAARAVGNAAGKNPLLIVIPCHRLVAAGGLGGFSCGLEIKQMLLKLEGVLPADAADTAKPGGHL